MEETQTQPQAQPAPQATVAPQAPLGSEKKYKVLIIDDDKFLLDMYSMKFVERQFTVEVAFGSMEALEKLKGGVRRSESKFRRICVCHSRFKPKHFGYISYPFSAMDGELR
jgi:CheY-like chemotaxis protein